MMTLPKITHECLTAILEKATQQDPQAFALETMVEMLADQPVLMEGISTVIGPFITVLSENEAEGQQLDESLRAELIIMAQFCIIGITIKAINAQIEADEMNEVWA
jgi:hypothetical protein